MEEFLERKIPKEKMVVEGLQERLISSRDDENNIITMTIMLSMIFLLIIIIMIKRVKWNIKVIYHRFWILIKILSKNKE